MNALQDIYLRSRSSGVRIANEYLFMFDAAVRVLREASDQGIVCESATGWYMLPQFPGRLIEDQGTDFTGQSQTTNTEVTAACRAAEIENHLRHHLSAKHRFVGMTFRQRIDWPALAAAWDALPGPTYPLPVDASNEAL